MRKTPETAIVSASGHPPLRVSTEIVARLLAEEVLVEEGGVLTVSPALHVDSVLAVLAALGSHPQREAIVI